MTPQEYQALAARTANPELDRVVRAHAARLGFIGEVGELADLVKKKIAQGHPWDVVKVAGEIGDVLWYLAEDATANGRALIVPPETWSRPNEALAKVDLISLSYRMAGNAAMPMAHRLVLNLADFAGHFGLTLEVVAAANIEKLRRRYPAGFEIERSLNREEVAS